MSWAASKTIITAALGSYREIPENKTNEDASQTHKHHSYSLKYLGTADTEQYLNHQIAFSHLVELRMNYENNLATERDTNADNFITLQKTIAALTGFKGFTDERTFEDFDNKHTIGTITFEIGLEACGS